MVPSRGLTTNVQSGQDQRRPMWDRHSALGAAGCYKGYQLRVFAMSTMTASLPSALDASALQSELLTMLQRNAEGADFARMRERVQSHVADEAQRSLLLGNIAAAVAVREQQDLQLRREKGLQVVLETAHDLTAIRDLELVLQAIVRRARQIFAADIGYLTHFDRLRNDFYIRATDGAISERFKNVRVPPEHGICGHVLKHKTPYHSSSYMNDAGFTHDQGIDLAVTEEGVRSLLGAPLMVGNHCIGVLCICDRQPRSHQPWEVSMLATLAAHAAIAIENARLFQEAQVALQHASQANAQLHRQAEEIEAAADAHERMTKLVARGSAITEILALMASMLRGQVWLLDEAEQLVHASPPASSTTADPLRLRVEEQDALHRALGDSRMSGGSRPAGAFEGQTLRVSALMGAERLLGALVMLTPAELTATEVRIFERGALVAGVALLARERSELALSSEAAATIRALVSWQQEHPSALQARAAPLGLDLAGPLRVVVLGLEGRDIEYALRRVRPALPKTPHAALLMEACEGLVVAVAPEALFAPLCQAITATLLPDTRLDLVGVASDPVPRVDALPQAFAQLKRCIGVLRALGRRHELVPQAALNVYATLFEQRQGSELGAFIEATAGVLAAQDRRRGTDLCGTLLCYLEQAQNARAAAEALGIHVNTLRQRLDSVDALIGPWREGGRALELHMGLRLHMLRTRLG